MLLINTAEEAVLVPHTPLCPASAPVPPPVAAAAVLLVSGLFLEVRSLNICFLI